MQIRDLTESELRARLKEHVADRVFQEATLAIYRSSFDQANMLRNAVAERRDAFKWVAAISTAAFFFIGQSLPKSGLIPFDASRWLLLAELAFGLSVLGAAGYVLVVDSRVAKWMREIYQHTVRVTTALQSMDANAMSMREYLDDKDLTGANLSFKETYREKERLGKILKEEAPHAMPMPGRVGIASEYLCVGGLLAGVALVGADLIGRVVL